MYNQRGPNNFQIMNRQANFNSNSQRHHMKSPSWSSINQNGQNYQQMISPLNYKVSNPSSSLIMSSLRDDEPNQNQTTQSTISHPFLNNNFQRNKKPKEKIHNDFYQYLMMEENQNSTNKNAIMNDTSFDQKFMKSTNNNTFYPTQQNSIHTQQDYVMKNNFSPQQSLHHLEQSKEQLSFLKFKLQQAYQKLQKQILNSYDLQEQIQMHRNQLLGQKELLQLQKNQNQKLKFTLKAIMKNKSFMQDEIEKQIKKKENLDQNSREQQLKETFKLQLDLKQKTKTYETRIQALTVQNNKLKIDLNQLNKQLQKVKNQLIHKVKYLQNLTIDIQAFEDLRSQNKKLLIKQTQYLNKLNILQSEIRKTTDEKVTAINRLRHQLSLIQKQNGELIQENQDLSHTSFIVASNNTHVPYSPSSVPKRAMNKSYTKVSVNKHMKTQNNPTPKTPMIIDSEDQDHMHEGRFQQTFSQFALDSLNQQNTLISKSRGSQRQSNKENISSQNLNITKNNIFPSSQVNDLKGVSKSVGKWKRPQSMSNNSSTYFQSISIDNQKSTGQQQTGRQSISSAKHSQGKQVNSLTKQSSLQIRQINPHAKQTTNYISHINNLIQNKLSMTTKQPMNMAQSQDKKLSKYQQHRKNLQNQLSGLQKIKRPTPQQRQKIQKLQKQLYYVDSDIAGLKRKIRSKY